MTARDVVLAACLTMVLNAWTPADAIAQHGQAITPSTARRPPVGPRMSQGGTTRRLWSEPAGPQTPVDLLGGPSPDDRLLSFVDWETGDLAVRDLVTGQHRRLTNKGPWEQSPAFALMSVFSPDGRSIAYNWYTENANDHLEVRVVDVASSSSRTLVTVKTNEEYVEPADWTPDGKFLVLIGQRDGTGHLALLPIAGGERRLIKSFPDWRHPFNAIVSPDGRYLAYTYPPRRDDGRREVYLLPLGGGSESVVAAHEADDYVIGWTPDGSQLVIGSERGGSPSIMTVRIENGKPRGSPVTVRKDLWRATGVRMSARGSLYYGVQTGNQDVYVASLDMATGKLRSQPTSITQRPGFRYSAPAWSPDSRYVAYITHFSNNTNVIGSRTITIRSVESGESRDLRPRLAYIQGLVWTPDAKGIMMRARDDKGRNVLARLDLGSGEVTGVVDSSRSVPAFSRDGKWLYYVPARATEDMPSRLVARHLTSGEERTLYVARDGNRLGPAARIVTSSDGRLIIFLVRDRSNKPRWMVMNTNGGDARSFILDGLSPDLMRAQWADLSPDGRHFLFAADPPGDNLNETSVFRVAMADGKPELIWSGVSGFELSPDGRRVAYVSGRVASELWVLEEPALGFERKSAGRR